MKNLLVAVAEIEPVFQEGREDGADARMPALAQPFDDSSPCRSSVASRSSPRAAGNLRHREIGRWYRESTPEEGEQQP